MFEGKSPFAAMLRNEPSAVATDEPLREISWSDLRARLEAARDLRQSLVLAELTGTASFGAPVAHWAESKQTVNLSVLGNGKGHHAMPGTLHDAAHTGAPRN
jgi:hypothetical protein